jgi:5'-methylthioadenosine phosphorylase
VRFLARFADLVGMTVASECVAANQTGLAYAAVCIVDNLANGIADEPLTMEEYQRGAAANADRLRRALDRVVPELAA